MEHYMAVFVQRANVAAMIPAIGIQRFGSLFRVTIIAVTQVVTADKHFSALARRQILARFPIDTSDLDTCKGETEFREAELRVHGVAPGRAYARGQLGRA